MKALTIKQPWAHLIVKGIGSHHKTIETRTWYTDYRGPLAIHASRTIDPVAQSLLARCWPQLTPAEDGYPLGAIIGVAELADCRLLTKADEEAACCWCRGRYGLFLTHVRALDEPIPIRGQLGLWDVPADVVKRLMTAR